MATKAEFGAPKGQGTLEFPRSPNIPLVLSLGEGQTNQILKPVVSLRIPELGHKCFEAISQCPKRLSYGPCCVRCFAYGQT